MNWNAQLICTRSQVHLIHWEKWVQSENKPSAAQLSQARFIILFFFSRSPSHGKLLQSPVGYIQSLLSVLEAFVGFTYGCIQVTAKCLSEAWCKIHWDPLKIFSFNLDLPKILIKFSSQALPPISSWSWLCDTNVAWDITSVKCGWIALTCSCASIYSVHNTEMFVRVFLLPGDTYLYVLSVCVHIYSLLTTTWNCCFHIQACHTFKLWTNIGSYLWLLMPRRKNKRKNMHFWVGEKRIALRRFLFRYCDE